MLTTAYYFLQVILCSAVMMGYYWLVLRNKRFHQYNRFYLMAIALLSWVVPLIKIQLGHTTVTPAPQVMQFLQVVADNNSQIEETITRKGFEWNWGMLVSGLYIAVALVLLVGMIRALFRIYQLLKLHSCKNVGEVYLILTQAKGTPFSFFRYIFWNEEIDIRSEAGKQILQHELTHVQQKHSFDKLFIQIILIAGWFNPFFWLIRKEMDMIHEFIADKKAVNNGDTASLAQMLLTAAYPNQQFMLTNPFFFSPIKRRLQMLTNNKNPRFSYVRRLVVLPLLAIVVVLFAFRNKDQKTTTISLASVMEKVADKISDLQRPQTSIADVLDLAMLDRTYTVVIDAGHGGTDKGVTAADGTTEAAITLQLAKTIRDLNENQNIRIVLRREGDVFENVTTITEKVNEQNPDLFISLHVNQTTPIKTSGGKTIANPASGIEMFIPEKAKAADYEGSVALANYISSSLVSMKEKMLGIKTRDKGIWVLNNVKSPAVLLETGFMTNETDLKKLKDADYQKQMAKAVLSAINTFLSKPVQNKLNLEKLGVDTVVIKQKGKENEVKLVFTPNQQNTNEKTPLYIIDGKKGDKAFLETISPNDIDRVDVLKDASAVARYGEDARNGVIIITTKEYTKKKPLIIVDGKKMEGADMNAVSPDKIESIDVLKNESATAIYGEEGKNGVILITTKEGALAQKNKTTEVSTFLKTDKDGNVTWKPTSNEGSGIHMQAYAKDRSGNLIKNSKVFVKEIIYQGSLKSKLKVWEEEHELKTDDEGIYSLIVGRGVKPVGSNYSDLSHIDWGNGPFFINSQLSIPPSTGLASWDKNQNYIDMGTVQMMSVPYALFDGNSNINWNQQKEDEKQTIKINSSLNSGTYVTTESIPTESNTIKNHKTENDKVFTVTQIPAEFPGGPKAWEKYLLRNLDINIVKKNGGPAGKYKVVVSFIVDKSGNLSDIKAENDPGYGTKDEAIRVIAKGPKWKPAVQNGQTVVYRQKQAISFYSGDQILDIKAQELDRKYISGVANSVSVNLSQANNTSENKSTNTNVNMPAEFPGGLPAFSKYLERNLDMGVVKKNGGPPGRYTVLLSFAIDEEGNVSNIKALNDPGFGTKEEAMRMIEKGPKWKPAIMNGHPAIYLHKQTITFVVSDNKAVVKPNNNGLDTVNIATYGRYENVIDLKTKAHLEKIEKEKSNNLQTFFTVDGNSSVHTDKGSSAEINGKTDIIFVNGIRMTPKELNSKFKRSDFIIVAASDSEATIKKFGKGALLVSSKVISQKEVSSYLE